MKTKPVSLKSLKHNQICVVSYLKKLDQLISREEYTRTHTCKANLQQRKKDNSYFEVQRENQTSVRAFKYQNKDLGQIQKMKNKTSKESNQKSTQLCDSKKS